jgi:tetratricopeptide (TPR) repeat protein
MARALPGREGNNDFQHFLGRALLEEGRTLGQKPDRRPQAEENFHQAVTIWTGLQSRYPQSALYLESLAMAYEARGQIRTTLGRLDPAAEDLNKSRTTLELLVRKSPDSPGFLGQLGRTYGALGRLALARGDARRAVGWLTKANQSFSAALQRAPESAIDRRLLEEVEAERKQAQAKVPADGERPPGR